ALQSGQTEQAESIQRLEIMVSAMTAVRTLLLVDANGSVLASNRPLLIGMNFHDDGRYRSIRANPDPNKLFVSPPFITPHAVYTVTLGKAVVDTEGRFAGYVIAALDPEYFDALLKASVY
ncbi:hypothetical protein RZS08_26640, partial [Arthrospira platensis SPKY1]|nr:hypothetical protein [Arthrospira platensis SPKY1]